MSCENCVKCALCGVKAMIDVVTLPVQRPAVYTYSAEHCDEYDAQQ